MQPQIPRVHNIINSSINIIIDTIIDNTIANIIGNMWCARSCRDHRRLWIRRINAASRISGLSYSRLINVLKQKNVELNRKVLAQLSVLHPQSFQALTAFIAK